MLLLRFRDSGFGFTDLLGVALSVARDNQQHLEAVPRSKARVIGGERIEIRRALLGELDGARPDGVEMFQSLSQAGETANRADRLRCLRPSGTIRNESRKLGFPVFI